VIILIGFCCDYCLHVCHVFNEAKEHGIKRGDLRMRYSLSRMGSTVFAGAVTTVGAGFFLYCAQTAFNQNVGFIIAFTIVVSLIHTLFFFSSLCIMFGPHGNFGDICCCCPTGGKSAEISDPQRLPEVGRKVQVKDASGTMVFGRIEGRSTEDQKYRVALDNGETWTGPLLQLSFVAEYHTPVSSPTNGAPVQK